MKQDSIIYDRAKENLRQYWRLNEESLNKRVIYQCSMLVYLIKQEYQEDTRSFSIMPEQYLEEKTKLFQLRKKIKKGTDSYKEALEAYNETLEYIELVIRPRVNMRAIA
jgi:hypothetical protein